MDVQLDPELQEFIKQKIDSHEAQSVAEVVNNALRLMKETEDQPPEEDISELRQEVLDALAELDNGESAEWDVEDAKARLLERYARRKRAN